MTLKSSNGIKNNRNFNMLSILRAHLKFYEMGSKWYFFNNNHIFNSLKIENEEN